MRGRSLLAGDSTHGYQQNVGIIGAGHIGRRLIELLKNLTCQPCVFDPYLDAGMIRQLGARKVETLKELFATCRVVSLNAPTNETTRGCDASSWQVKKVIGHGYALATVYYGDLEPDFAEGWKMGLRAALSPAGTNTVFKADDWGAIGAWVWGLSRALDYLERDGAVDAKRVAVMGHSRLGKTALWAGAQDERFAIVISNNSGEGGASLVRRRFGENIADLVRMFPYWCCQRYRQYADNENALPVDAHMLIALAAPRPVYVASATEDLWCDPRGEFLAAKHAQPVYRLLGRAGLGVEEQPPPDKPVGDFVNYHLRTGKHGVTAYDWDQYLNFADRHFRR